MSSLLELNQPGVSYFTQLNKDIVNKDIRRVRSANACETTPASSASPRRRTRIDVVGKVPVATLVYHHAKHLISLTAVPAPGRANSAPVASAVSGYNMYRWAEDGVAYTALSDVAPAELDKFADLFRASPPNQ